MGFPIRKSADQSLFAAPHGLSQRTTSFIACACQGIHRTPLFHLIALITNARPFQDPCGSERETNGASIDAGPSKRAGSTRSADKTEQVSANIASIGNADLERPVSHENCPSAEAVKLRSACARSTGKGGTSGQLFSSRCQQTGSRPASRRDGCKSLTFSTNLSASSRRHRRRKIGGARRDRTDDLLLAKQALSQLSYGPPRTRRPDGTATPTIDWWAWVDSNYRPHPYQGCALTN